VSKLPGLKLFRLLPLVLAVALLGAVGVEAKYRRVRSTETVTVQPTATAEGVATGLATVGGGPVVRNGVPQSRPGLFCVAGRNGGATDVGVTGTKIRLASTMVQSGIGASFLGLSPIGMRAVVQKVNRAGGICGRILDLTLRDDGWRADLGQTFIQNFIKEGYFALSVVPSSEGLTAAITSGDIGKAKIPVVGTDGMLIQQYRSPWVWPVATATVSTMRIMAKHGYARGARSFAIVYDRRYKFGKEGADAFRRYVERLPGAKVKAFVGIQPGQASYSAEIQQFNGACRSGCDFVALLLEPTTAETWIYGRPAFGTKITSGAQTLFNDRFAQNCGAPCEGMLVWTGYNPPIGTLAALAGVRKYINDVKSVSNTADETNQFLQGAYLGMSVLVEALQRVGPELTRARLRQTLDAMMYSSDLSSALRWSPARRFANQRAQAFSIVVANGSFAGFRNEQTGFIQDPEL
jgi:ABC-type branched-subunit amino acid transport system substrate-binding protein